MLRLSSRNQRLRLHASGSSSDVSSVENFDPVIPLLPFRFVVVGRMSGLQRITDDRKLLSAIHAALAPTSVEEATRSVTEAESERAKRRSETPLWLTELEAFVLAQPHPMLSAASATPHDAISACVDSSFPLPVAAGFRIPHSPPYLRGFHLSLSFLGSTLREQYDRFYEVWPTFYVRPHSLTQRSADQVERG
jgi:hypothetical protein